MTEQMEIYDRLAIGDQLMRLQWSGHEEGLEEPMSAEDAVEEFQDGLQASRNNGTLQCVGILLALVRLLINSIVNITPKFFTPVYFNIIL